MKNFQIVTSLPVSDFYVGEMPHSFNTSNILPCNTYSEALEAWEAFGENSHEIYINHENDFCPVTKFSNGTWCIDMGVEQKKVFASLDN